MLSSNMKGPPFSSLIAPQLTARNYDFWSLSEILIVFIQSLNQRIIIRIFSNLIDWIQFHE